MNDNFDDVSIYLIFINCRVSRNYLKLGKIREWNDLIGIEENLRIELLHWNWGNNWNKRQIVSIDFFESIPKCQEIHWNWGKSENEIISLEMEKIWELNYLIGIGGNAIFRQLSWYLRIKRPSARPTKSHWQDCRLKRFRHSSVNYPWIADIKKVGGNRGKFRNSIISFRNPMAINANWFKDDAMVIKAMASTEKCYLNANFMTTIRIKVAFLI